MCSPAKGRATYIHTRAARHHRGALSCGAAAALLPLLAEADVLGELVVHAARGREAEVTVAAAREERDGRAAVLGHLAVDLAAGEEREEAARRLGRLLGRLR